MNSNSHTLTRGNKQFELCNHLGNVLVTVQDRKRSVDVNADNQADYYLPYLRTVTNYYAYGSAMPGIGGSIKECTVTSTNLTLKKYPYFYTFSNDSTSGFTAGSGARSVTNPTHNVLHLESIWTTRPLANKSIYLKNGVNYALKFNLAGFSVVSGYTHTVKVRILLPGNTLSYTYTATGNQTINFTSNTTGNVTVEISSQITGSGTYSINPYIDIDNFNLSWDSTYTAYVNNCGSNAEKYKYGFNGEEIANEADVDDLYDLGARFYDSRLGRMFSVDPLSYNYPWQSEFAYCGNNPINIIDINGMGDEEKIYGQVKKGEGLSSFVVRYNISGSNLVNKMEAVALANPNIFKDYKSWSVGKTNQEKTDYFNNKFANNYMLTPQMELRLPSNTNVTRFFDLNFKLLDVGHVNGNLVIFKKDQMQTKVNSSSKNKLATSEESSGIISALRKFDAWSQGNSDPVHSAPDADGGVIQIGGQSNGVGGYLFLGVSREDGFNAGFQFLAGIENNKSSFCVSVSQVSGEFSWENYGGTGTNGSIGFGPASIVYSEYNIKKSLNSKPKYTSYGIGWGFSIDSWPKNTNVGVGASYSYTYCFISKKPKSKSNVNSKVKKMPSTKKK